MGRDRRATQQLQSRLLDAGATLATARYLYSNPTFVNPWHLSAHHWIVGYVLIRGALILYDHLVWWLIEASGAPPLPTRTEDAPPVRYVALDAKSMVFLSINSFNEWVFVQRLCHYLWHSPSVPRSSSDLGILNTIGALVVMFIVLDVCYAPCHHLLHTPALYPLIHKHHHRQHYPTRGYLDAGNEHPLEHLVGTNCTWMAVLAAVRTTGAHGATVFVFFNVHAALAMLNHSPYDVRWRLKFGRRDGGGGGGAELYSVGNHEMHHRKFTVNYAQYCMWYDYVMGTFAPYEGPAEPKGKQRKAQRVTTNQAAKKATPPLAEEEKKEE